MWTPLAEYAFAYLVKTKYATDSDHSLITGDLLKKNFCVCVFFTNAILLRNFEI